MLYATIGLAAALAISIFFNGMQAGQSRNQAETLEAANDNLETALGPVLAEQQRINGVLTEKRLEPFCEPSNANFNILLCSWHTCTQEQAAQGQIASESCGEVRKRILDRDRWDLCNKIVAPEDADATTVAKTEKRRTDCFLYMRQ